MKTIYEIENLLKDNLFTKREGIVNDTPVILIYPKKGIENIWTKENLYGRSLLIHKETHKILSRGFNKFFNYHERTDIDPEPNFLDCEFREKIDGTLLITSVINGKLNIRTRGTIDAYKQYPKSKAEYDNFIQIKYKAMFDWIMKQSDLDLSYLFEHTSPENIIVLNYGLEPKLRLLAIIDNKTGKLASNETCDKIANFCNIERPKKYSITSVNDVKNLLKIQNIEGFVLYYDSGQKMKKLKTEEYLEKHRMRTQFTHNTLFDAWKKYSEITKDSESAAYYLKDYLAKEYDYESIEHPALWAWWESLCSDARQIFDNYGLKSIELSKQNISRAEFAKTVKDNFPSLGQALAFLALKKLSFDEYRHESFKMLIKHFFEEKRLQLS